MSDAELIKHVSDADVLLLSNPPLPPRGDRSLLQSQADLCGLYRGRSGSVQGARCHSSQRAVHAVSELGLQAFASNRIERAVSSSPWRRYTTSWAYISTRPTNALVLCVDEKSQIQAFSRTGMRFFEGSIIT